ncbi:MAG: FAD-dependent oxidoreductase [Bryobacterales bacterium]|nr:FAD-dependent oxidoreductase [Bryobacterales bacterium]
MIEAEANHFGGRVRTARFDDRNYGELGAMRIPTVHNLTRHYVKEMGLTLRPFVQSNPEAYYYARGTKLKIKDESQLNALYPGLQGRERSMSPFDF